MGYALQVKLGMPWRDALRIAEGPVRSQGWLGVERPLNAHSGWVAGTFLMAG